LTEVISIKFRNKGKSYYFAPGELQISKGQGVIVETARGLEFADCVYENHMVNDDSIIPPLRPVIRIATEDDMRIYEENQRKEKEAFEICHQKIAEHELDMKLVDVEYSFDGSKILFCFTSEGRVDFRELVKDLAATFKMRIELRQIGVRDEARVLGGLGICGKPFCCAQFLDDFQPVSIKMAKTQGLSLNPTKISGTCGRLMCCLKYEQEAYEDLVKTVPKQDAFVDTPMGPGIVTDVNLLRRKLRVRLENQPELTIRTFDADEVTVLGGKQQRAEYLAAVADGTIVPEIKKPKLTVPKKEPAFEPIPEVIIPEPIPEPEIIVEEEPEIQEEKPEEKAKPRNRRPRRRKRNASPKANSGENAKPQQTNEPAPKAEKQEEKPAAPKNEGNRNKRNRRPRYRRRPKSGEKQAENK